MIFILYSRSIYIDLYNIIIIQNSLSSRHTGLAGAINSTDKEEDCLRLQNQACLLYTKINVYTKNGAKAVSL